MQHAVLKESGADDTNPTAELHSHGARTRLRALSSVQLLDCVGSPCKARPAAVLAWPRLRCRRSSSIRRRPHSRSRATSCGDGGRPSRASRSARLSAPSTALRLQRSPWEARLSFSVSRNLGVIPGRRRVGCAGARGRAATRTCPHQAFAEPAAQRAQHRAAAAALALGSASVIQCQQTPKRAALAGEGCTARPGSV